MPAALNKGLVQVAEFQVVCLRATLGPNVANVQLHARVFDVIGADVRWG